MNTEPITCPICKREQRIEVGAKSVRCEGDGDEGRCPAIIERLEPGELADSEWFRKTLEGITK